MRIKPAEDRYGTSRSKLYLLIGRGLIRAVKLDGATLIDVESADAFYAALPTAEIHAA